MSWETIARYLAGESPDGEVGAVRAWLASHPADAALVQALDGTLDRLTTGASPDVDVERALRDVVVRLDEPDVVPIRPLAPVAPVARPWYRSGAMLRAAAIVGIAATGALTWWTSHRSPAENPIQTVATAIGHRDSLRLPDGTRVVLGPSSQLTVAAGYGGTTREVELQGEGWFDVVHDDARTFTVRAGGATIRDVGTKFVVRTGDAPNAPRVRVAVQEGAVLLGDDVVLHRGDVGVVDATGRAGARPGTATDDDVAWTRGRLVFHDAPLDDVRAELRRWYGIELRVDDPALAKLHLTTSFNGEPVDHVLRVVALTLGAYVERRGDTAVVRPGGASGGGGPP